MCLLPTSDSSDLISASKIPFPLMKVLLHSIMTASLSAITAPRFMSESLMIQMRFIFHVNDFLESEKFIFEQILSQFVVHVFNDL